MSAPNAARKGILIGAAVLGALGVMAWIVNIRLGGAPMPEPGAAGAGIRFGMPADPSSRAEGAGALPVLAAAMPDFSDIAAWINSEPLTPAGLKGKVVLVDFWTYSCINCLRTLPYVTSWHEKYKDRGLVIVGVHTPEFAFEKVEQNVRDAVARHSIEYPVALDNGYATWNGYDNRYWP
ncbi:MAG: hypothetical protein RL272_1187, partial [Candidatus Parcubacteria bacterium]